MYDFTAVNQQHILSIPLFKTTFGIQNQEANEDCIKPELSDNRLCHLSLCLFIELFISVAYLLHSENVSVTSYLRQNH